MNTKDLENYIHTPQRVQKQDLEALEELTQKYPYAQSLQLLKLLSLKENHSFQ